MSSKKNPKNILWSKLWPLLNYFRLVSRVVFLTGPHSVTRCVNMRRGLASIWLMLPLLCISSTLFIPPAAPHVCPHVHLDTQPPNPGTYLHPTLQNMASTNNNQATVYKKIRQTARLFEMTFTSAPPHVLPHWPPVYLTNWLDWGGVCVRACMHECVCTWVGVHFASGVSTSMWTVVVVAKQNIQACTETSLIDMWDPAGSAAWVTFFANGLSTHIAITNLSTCVLQIRVIYYWTQPLYFPCVSTGPLTSPFAVLKEWLATHVNVKRCPPQISVKAY